MVKTRREHNATRGALRKLLNKSRCDTMALLAQLNEEYGIGADADAPATVIKIDIPADPNPMEIANIISKMDAHLPHIADIPQPKNNLQRAQYRHAQDARYKVIERQLKQRIK